MGLLKGICRGGLLLLAFSKESTFSCCTAALAHAYRDFRVFCIGVSGSCINVELEPHGLSMSGPRSCSPRFGIIWEGLQPALGSYTAAALEQEDFWVPDLL